MSPEMFDKTLSYSSINSNTKELIIIQKNQIKTNHNLEEYSLHFGLFSVILIVLIGLSVLGLIKTEA